MFIPHLIIFGMFVTRVADAADDRHFFARPKPAQLKRLTSRDGFHRADGA
jgi:hypothetical protein